MNSVQMHLALTHVPVVLSLAGLAMLVASFFIKNITITRISYVLLLIAGVSAIPVFFTGEGTEEVVEKLPGVTEVTIERHETVAKFAMIAVSSAGLVALAALLSSGWKKVSHVLKVTVLLVSVICGWLMIQTAHLGGQIRHTEIRAGVTFQDNNQHGSGIRENTARDMEKNDD